MFDRSSIQNVEYRFGLEWPSLEVCWLNIERCQHICGDEEEKEEAENQ